MLTLHRTVTLDALDPDVASGLWESGMAVVVDDLYGTIIHAPPPAVELPERMKLMCAFVNGSIPEEFVHPVVRAITLHFWLAYDHLIVDGSGRTARALFYWPRLHQKYWLFEFYLHFLDHQQGPWQE